MKIVYLLVALLCFANNANADVPEYAIGWQWNNNVKISWVYTYWGNLPSQVRLDNGQFCYINSDEKELLSTVLAMRATGTTGQFVCAEVADSSVDGQESRHLHRIAF